MGFHATLWHSYFSVDRSCPRLNNERMRVARQHRSIPKKASTGKVGGGRRVVIGKADVVMQAAKAEIQNRSRWLVASGRRSQESLCLFSSADAQAAIVHFTDVDFD